MVKKSYNYDDDEHLFDAFDHVMSWLFLYAARYPPPWVRILPRPEESRENTHSKEKDTGQNTEIDMSWYMYPMT
jgi:hypothetical protein